MYVGDVGLPELSDSAKIWRYVDLAKFMSMLISKSLWFSRVGAFEDQYEGTLPIPPVESFIKNQSFRTAAEGLEFQTRLLGALNAISRRYGFVNCWHLNDGESAAFWKIYSGEGIAIQSTVGRLKQSISDGDGRGIKIGRVKYVRDPEAESAENSNQDLGVLIKRDIYDYEREVRAFFFRYPAEATPEAILREDVLPGLNVPVDLDVLIERVYVAPNRQSWFKAIIESTLTQYECQSKSIVWSRMGERPKFWRDSVDLIKNQELLRKALGNNRIP